MAAPMAIPNPKIKKATDTHIWINDTLVAKLRVKVELNIDSSLVTLYIDNEQVWSRLDIGSVAWLSPEGPMPITGADDAIHYLEGALKQL